MPDSVRPHRQQPLRLPRPWDSPGKNTGVGCHFLLQCMKVKSESEVAQSCPTLSDPMDCGPSGSSIHGIFQARVLEWGAITATGKKNSCDYVHRVASVMFDSLQPGRLWPARLLCQRGGSPGKNTGAYWSILVTIPCCLSCKPPEYLVLPEPL